MRTLCKLYRMNSRTGIEFSSSCFRNLARFSTKPTTGLIIARRKLPESEDPLITTLKKAMASKRKEVTKYSRRQKLLSSGMDLTPDEVELQVIGAGGRGTPRSLMVSTTHSNYLFNCGEGTQRIAAGLKLKLGKVDNIMITHKSWTNIGGLLGMALTLGGFEVPHVTLHGPPGVEGIIAYARGFADSKTTNIRKKNYDQFGYIDKSFEVNYVHLTSSQRQLPPASSFESKTAVNTVRTDEDLRNPQNSTEDGEGTGKEEAAGDQKTDSQNGGAKRRKVDSEMKEDEDISTVYICKPKQRRRKVDKDKLKALNLDRTPGPWIGQLVKGESVTLPDGRKIRPEDILISDDELEGASVFIVLECPDEGFLDSLLASSRLQQLQSGKLDRVDLVVHMSPATIVTEPRYQEFFKRFSQVTKHLYLNENSSSSVMEAPYELQSQLNQIHTDIFPKLPHTWQGEITPEPQDSRTVQAACGLKYIFRPGKLFSWDQCVSLNSNATTIETENDELKKELMLLDQKLQVIKEEAVSVYPEVVFLGTGSSHPSCYRNVTSILVHSSADNVMVLDCGEDTIGQMYRQYGDRVQEVLCKISAVFISHMHADHHMGLTSIVFHRMEALKKAGLPYTRLFVISPTQFSRWISYYHTHIGHIAQYLSRIPIHKIIPSVDDSYNVLFENFLKQTGMKQVLPVEVHHCKNSYGVVLEHRTGWKLVYSGDTMPCDGLVIAGQNCDLLIHESSMEDALLQQATKKTHSTTSQAILIGQQMQARFTLLTHFSQRYHKIPLFNENFSSSVGIAFDNMRVKLGDCNKLPLFRPALETLFKEELEALKTRYSKPQ